MVYPQHAHPNPSPRSAEPYYPPLLPIPQEKKMQHGKFRFRIQWSALGYMSLYFQSIHWQLNLKSRREIKYKFVCTWNYSSFIMMQSLSLLNSSPFFFPFESWSDLVEQFNIIAVPKLIILSPDGEVISETGRKEVADRGIVCFKFWQNAAKIDWNHIQYST